jgi:hypothetical protein
MLGDIQLAIELLPFVRNNGLSGNCSLSHFGKAVTLGKYADIVAGERSGMSYE